MNALAVGIALIWLVGTALFGGFVIGLVVAVASCDRAARTRPTEEPGE